MTMFAKYATFLIELFSFLLHTPSMTTLTKRFKATYALLVDGRVIRGEVFLKKGIDAETAHSLTLEAIKNNHGEPREVHVLVREVK